MINKHFPLAYRFWRWLFWLDMILVGQTLLLLILLIIPVNPNQDVYKQVFERYGRLI